MRLRGLPDESIQKLAAAKRTAGYTEEFIKKVQWALGVFNDTDVSRAEALRVIEEVEEDPYWDWRGFFWEAEQADEPMVDTESDPGWYPRSDAEW